ncbi:MAG: hypothetical protein ACRDHL_15075 [Candidatus Promineifilaceae bacterium]
MKTADRPARYSRLHRLASAGLALLFGLTLALALAGRTALNVLRAPQTGHAVINSVQLEQRSPALLASFLPAYALPATSLAGLPASAWEAAAGSLLPDEWLNDSLHTALEALYAWLDVPAAPLPDLSLDVRPLQAALRDQRGVVATLALLQNTPRCPAGTTEFTILSADLVSCLPEQADITEIAGRVALALAGSLPPSVSLADLEAAGLVSDDVLAAAQAARAKYHWLDSALDDALRLALLLLCLYALLYSAGPRQLLRALPRPLFFAAALSSLLLIATYLAQLLALEAGLLAALPGAPPPARQLAAEASRAALAQVWPAWLLRLALLAGIGFGLGLAGFLLGRRAGGARRAQAAVTLPPQRRIRRRFR